MIKDYPLKTRQVCLFFIAFLPVTKFFMMPSVICGIANEDMWISGLINLLADFSVILALQLTCRKYNTTYIQTLEQLFGQWGSKAVLFLYALFFLLKSVVPIIEQRDYITLSLYGNDPDIYYFLPFIACAFFLCTKNLRAVARLSDIFWVITVIGYLLMFALSISNTDFEAILPVGAQGANKILNGSKNSFIWFGDSAYFLFMAGNFKQEKNSTLKISVFYILSMIMTVVFLIVFYGIFTSIGFRQKFALTETSKYMTVINNIGRFDYFGITCIILSNIIAISLPLFFSCKLTDYVFSIKYPFITPAIVMILTVIMLTVFNQYSYSIEQFAISVWYIFFIMSVILPLVIITAKVVKNAKQTP